MATIVIVDDHAMIRRGLRAVLEARPGWEVVEEGHDGVAGLQAIERQRPSVAVIDISMPELSGWEVLRLAKERVGGVRLVVLSVHADLEHVVRAFRFGADAYVAKAAAADQLVEGIEAALAGQRFVSRPLDPASVWQLLDGPVHAVSPLDVLTGREREVFHLTATGHSVAKCAELLSISPRTIEVHRGSIFAKLELEGQADLMRWARERGLLS